MYGASWAYQRDGRYGLIPYKAFGNRTLIRWSGWLPFLFSNQVENKAAGMKIHSTIIFIRGKTRLSSPR